MPPRRVVPGGEHERRGWGLQFSRIVRYLRQVMEAEEWAFCREALQRHSRTFAIPIGMLTPRLERAITTAYLLCRIADTVEDTAEWRGADKQRLYRQLEDAIEGCGSAQAFCDSVRALPGGDAEERKLLLGLGRVLAVFDAVPSGLRQACAEGILELTGGMAIFSRRRPGADGVRCVSSEADLDRYCYFVAGVIGKLLTECFLQELPQTSSASAVTLRANAEAFGAGLQLVNILRDISTDLQRDVCYVPRTLFDAAGLSPADLCDPKHEAAVRHMLTPLFDTARDRLDAAFQYTLALPAEAKAVRQFCLVPLWLAVATLELCRGDAGLLRPDGVVKLPRQRVMSLIAGCVAICGDNARLTEAYALLDADSPVEAA